MSNGPQETEKNHTTLATYTNEGFEEFLQQSELAGLSRERQDELITIFLAQDIPLEKLILHDLSELGTSMQGFVSRHTALLVVLVVLICGMFFVVHQDYQARSGKISYQPWQCHMAAIFKICQMKLLKPLVDLKVLFNSGCLLANPFLGISALATRGPGPNKEVDCKAKPRRLTVRNASEYGEDEEYDSKEFPLPFVLHDSLAGWKLTEKSTLHDFHEIVTSGGMKGYPCASFLPGQSVTRIPDPLSELMAGDLRDNQGTKVEYIVFSGCNQGSKRALRSVSQSARPVFLDTTVELLGEPRAIAAGDISPGKTVEVPIKELKENNREMEVYMVQVFGESRVVMRDLDCSENDSIERTLVPGDVLAVGPEDSLHVQLAGKGEKLMIYQGYLVAEEDDGEEDDGEDDDGEGY